MPVALPDAIESFITRWKNSGAAEETRGIIRWLRPDYQNPVSNPRRSQTADTGRANRHRNLLPISNLKFRGPTASPTKLPSAESSSAVTTGVS